MKRREKVKKMVNARNQQTGIRIKNTRTKRINRRMSAKQFFMIVILLFVFMGSGIGYVWSNFERTQIGYDLSELKKEELRLVDRAAYMQQDHFLSHQTWTVRLAELITV